MCPLEETKSTHIWRSPWRTIQDGTTTAQRLPCPEQGPITAYAQSMINEVAQNMAQKIRAVVFKGKSKLSWFHEYTLVIEREEDRIRRATASLGMGGKTHIDNEGQEKLVAPT